MSKITKEFIRAYALKNALAHEGKAIAGAVLSSLFHEGLKKEEVKSIIKDVNDIIEEINSLTIEQQKEEFEKFEKKVSKRKSRQGLPLLPRAKKGVVMRFAPSPSGPLHAMHALNASFSLLYVKKYGGKFYVRIEDTNPENIYKPAYRMIAEEAKWLSHGLARIVIQSERISLYYKHARKLIRKNASYVCTCKQEEFKSYVEKMENCPCRNVSVKENMGRWEKMLDKKGYKEGEAVLRFKSSMNHKNPAMRDFPLARICLREHALQGKKYRVWPLMNLAVAVDDIEMEMTHMIRGKDHRDNAERQKMIFKVLGKKYPWSAFHGRIHFKDLEFSTTQFRKAIEEGNYKGWDDPRLPTIASLKKQGYKPEAFWKLAEHIGISEVDKIISRKDFFELLDNFNRE